MKLSLSNVAVSVAACLASSSAGDAPQAPRIPLRAGLTIVTALNQPETGDYESIKVITQAGDKEVRLRYSAEVMAPSASSDDNPLAALLGGSGGAQAGPKGDRSLRHVNTTRTISRQDLKTAHEYRHLFSENGPTVYPGSTAVGVSASVLDDLKTTGQTPMKAQAGGIAGAMGHLLAGMLGGAASELREASLLSGTLKRVESGTVPVRVILNDQPVELRAVHARGQLGDEPAEFWILDDVDNPLSLRWAIGGDTLQVVKLSYRVEETNATGGGAPAPATAAASTTAARIEHDLEKEGRAIVYGIYFDFASDRIKDESTPVLAEIAKVLQENPTWSLAVEGHTDNIGGDAYNLDLSKRRSAAVKQALVTGHRIAGPRLQASGYGAARPKDGNDTLEGRARNRRVELVKQ